MLSSATAYDFDGFLPRSENLRGALVPPSRRAAAWHAFGATRPIAARAQPTRAVTIFTLRGTTAKVARIFTVQLRTTDIDGARSFYARVLGTDAVVIAPLPPQAVARGARPHWLGYIDVPDLDRALAAFVARGATPLGPRAQTAEGLDFAVIRDPGGAVIALSTQPPGGAQRAPEVVWHQLNTADVSRAKRDYAELFGWRCDAPAREPSAGVVNHPFSWERAGAPAGAMADIAGRPGVHAHWLFHFAVPSLDRALESVREWGGLTLPVIELANGRRVAVCDDAQGAAFALIEAGA